MYIVHAINKYVHAKGCVLYRRSAYFRSARKNYFNFEVTTNFVKKFKAHFGKKLLY